MTQPNPLLAALTREGVLIHVSIRYWRGTKKLHAEDIGLDREQLSERLIHLGHKRLLPKDALQELAIVESRAHAMVESNTFPFLNGIGHFLPNARLAEVTQRLKELESDFLGARDRFLSKYSALRDAASSEWRTLAMGLTTNPERLVSTIEASFPLPRSMLRFFRFDVQLFQVSIPDRVGLEIVTAAEQQEISAVRERAATEAAAKIRRDTEVFVQDCIASMREQTARLCEEMLVSINSSETGVHQKTLNRLVRFIDQFRAMNFANDAVMQKTLDETRRELLSKTAEEYRDSTYARSQLVAGLSKLRDTATDLAKQNAAEIVQRFGSIGRRKFSLAA